MHNTIELEARTEVVGGTEGFRKTKQPSSHEAGPVVPDERNLCQGTKRFTNPADQD